MIWGYSHNILGNDNRYIVEEEVECERLAF